MGDGYKNRGSNAAGLGFKNRGAKLLDGAAYANRGATDGTHETFKNRGQAWGTGVFYNRSVSDFASLSILGSAAFFAPLKSTLVLTRGSGNPTYTRATSAWEFDNEGNLITVPSDVARFGGGRAVVNLCPTPSNTLTVGANKTVTFASAAIVTFSMGAGAGTATFSGTGGATGTLSAGASRVQATKTITAGTFVVTASVADLVDLQIENVTGQADQTASEYVSAGVLSAPYHGAGVDGVKWFDTHKSLSAISESSLLGYHAEGARTNSLLYSRDLTNAAWVNTNVTAVKTATGIDNAANSASTLTAGAADATILQTLSLAAAARSSSAYVKRRTGSGNIYFTRDGGTSWTDITASVGASWTRVKIENSSVLNPSIGFKIATSGDEIDVDCVQDEAGTFISSPIVTTSAAVTRNSDDLYYANNLNNAVGTARCIGMTTIPAVVGTDGMPLKAGSGSGLILYYSGSGSRNNISVFDSTNGTATAGTGASVLTGMRKYASRWTGSTLSIVKDGAAPSSTTFDGSMGSSTDLYVGTNTFGWTKDVYIWSTALTDAQLQQVTA